MADGGVPRTPVIAGNWKMHTTLAEARALAAAVRDGCRGLAEIRVAVCPPFTALAAVAEVLAGSAVLLGAQDAHWETAGAFTGCGVAGPGLGRGRPARHPRALRAAPRARARPTRSCGGR